MTIKSINDIIDEIIRINEILRRFGYYNKNMDDLELIELQKDILDLVAKVIDFYDDAGRFDLWEKACIAQALQFISQNIDLNKTTRWLWVGLAEIEQSTVEKNNRNDEAINRDIDKITKQILHSAIKKLIDRLDMLSEDPFK